MEIFVNKFIRALFLSLIFIANFALADDWKHSELQSSEGHSLTLSYKVVVGSYDDCLECTLVLNAKPLWLNLKKSELKER